VVARRGIAKHRQGGGLANAIAARFIRKTAAQFCYETPQDLLISFYRSNRRPGEGRDPFHRVLGAEEWIPAFAGMTKKGKWPFRLET
jgi:hypothetical protein